MRIIHFLVIGVLVFAAAYVYRIKMESTSRVERVLRLNAEISDDRPGAHQYQTARGAVAAAADPQPALRAQRGSRRKSPGAGRIGDPAVRGDLCGAGRTSGDVRGRRR